jgi:hypothetical protein
MKIPGHLSPEEKRRIMAEEKARTIALSPAGRPDKDAVRDVLRPATEDTSGLIDGGPMAKIIDGRFPEGTIVRARFQYLMGTFGGEDVPREEELDRIAHWLAQQGYLLGPEDVRRWHSLRAPDGVDWDVLRESWDGRIVSGRAYPFPDDAEEDLSRRILAEAVHIMGLCMASLRYTDLYDEDGNPVKQLFTAEGVAVPVGGLKPKTFADVKSAWQVASDMAQQQVDRLKKILEGDVEREKIVAQVAAEVLTAIQPTPDQMASLREMIETGKVGAEGAEKQAKIATGLLPEPKADAEVGDAGAQSAQDGVSEADGAEGADESFEALLDREMAEYGDAVDNDDEEGDE